MNKFITNSYKQTQKLGEKLAKEILKQGLKKTAIVLALQGNLGGGKTTFLQGFAKGLNIQNKVLSPTFNIYKKFQIPNLKSQIPKFNHFYHFDCYRIKNSKEILEMGFGDIILNSENIIAIEWSEKIKKELPRSAIIIKFDFIDKNQREIVINF